MTDTPLLPAEFAGFDLLATMVVVASAQGECLFANAAFENIMRLSRRTAQKAQLPDWFDDPQRLLETLDGVAANHYSSSRFDALLRESAGVVVASHPEGPERVAVREEEDAAQCTARHVHARATRIVSRIARSSSASRCRAAWTFSPISLMRSMSA